MTTQKKHLLVMGTRGIPATHGGFETFAERLALFLVDRGWDVSVYCQEEGDGDIYEDVWRTIRRIHIPVSRQGAAGTVFFDWKATQHVKGESGLVLTLGYNTAIFCLWLTLWGIPNVINMDGIEWQRRKWGKLAKIWFYLNERAGCWLGNQLIADHPEIKKHLSTRVNADKISMIPYGADLLDMVSAGQLEQFGLEPQRYLTLIARPEPENSVLEIVTAFSTKPRGFTLVVLGRYEPQINAYHRAVLQAAGPQVKFLGAIYDSETVQALRYHCVAYIHGHQVGGTNPSLVEAMGAGNPILAHDNKFNRWVAGEGALYFGNETQLSSHLEQILSDSDALKTMQLSILSRFNKSFTWSSILGAYERLLEDWLPAEAIAVASKN